MNLGIESNGALQIEARMEKLLASRIRIARRAVGAANAVSVKAGRDVAPGTTKQEIGSYIKIEGDAVIGRAGLVRFPVRGQKGKGPHAIYLEQGTKFIAARHFIQRALASARGAAVKAMERSVERSIETIVSAP